MTSLSIEEENYVRMGLLLTKVSPRAARALFDHEFAPSCLCASLRKEFNKLNDMRKQRVISKPQWDLLFPLSPDGPKSDTFDVTLIIALLRNLTNLNPPHGGFDKLPAANETTPGSDLARIKYYRNYLANVNDAVLENNFFNTSWEDISQAVGRLGGSSMKQECDLLKTKILDHINKELIMRIKDAIEQLTKSHKEEQKTVKRLKTSHKNVVSENKKEWFYKLPIICDGIVVDCIIDKRVQPKYQSLLKIFKRKEEADFSGEMYSPMNFSVIDFPLGIEFENLFIFNKVTEKPLRSEDKIKEYLYNAIEANQTNLCRYILMNSDKEAMIPVLKDSLDKAIKTKRTQLIKIVTSRIIEEFYQMHKETLDRNTSIWLGIECFCRTAKDSCYEDCICSFSKPKIIIEKCQSHIEDTYVHRLFCGFSTRIIDFTESISTEASIVANAILEKSNSLLIEGKISGKVAKELFGKHSNLSSIYPSSMKSKNFRNPGSHKMEKINCVNLVCRVKGVIPVGETHFPLEIEGVLTDVLEGATHLLGTLRIGDVVGGSNDQAVGTVGGFVKYYGLDTFLTCAHVVFGNEKVISLTKKEIHLDNCHVMKDTNMSDVTECIVIRHTFEHDNVDPSETSIDAALALIKKGELNMFNIARDDQTMHFCSAIGLSSPYLNYTAIDPAVLRDSRSFCGFSGNQRSKVFSSVSRNVLIRIPLHTQSGTIKMFNQICLYGMTFQRGDSGTCIYVDTPGCFNDQTGCIGMLIARSTCGNFVVTPMKEILKSFGL